jgi:cobalt/nickel transport protein
MSENKNNNKIWLYALGFLILIGILALPFLLKPSAEFAGADDQGSDIIMENAPGYTPWFSSFWEPPAETESMLFATQAAIGAIIIGYFVGYIRGRSATGKAEE